MRRPLPERAPDERERERFGFEGLGNTPTEAVTQKSNERLGARVDAPALALEGYTRAGTQLLLRRELGQHLFANLYVETRISARDRVADAISFAAIEENHLIGLGHRVAPTHMAHKNAAIRISQARRMRAFFSAPVGTCPVADDVPKSDGRC